MKKAARKALLTAKLYRPGKAGGGILMPGDPQREENLKNFLAGNHPLVPHVVYHGTDRDFSSFSRKAHPNFDAGFADDAIKNGEDPSDVGWYGKGFYLTPHPGHASFFAQHAKREGANVMPLHVSMKNPFILHIPEYASGAAEMDNALSRLGYPIDNKGRSWRLPSQQTAILKSMGHDGVLVYEGDTLKEIVAHDPGQLKSATGNQGTFDPNEDDINKAAGGRTGYGAGGGSRFVGEPDAEGKIYDPIDRATNLGRFLRGSKNVDKEGDHRVLYHITPKNFSIFKPGGDQPELSGKAIWLSPNRDYLPAYHNVRGGQSGYNEGTNVMPVWANIRNPLVLHNSQEAKAFCDQHGLPSAGFPRYMTSAHRAKLINLRHDGVFFQPGTPQEEVLALHPNQVKSAIGNQGTFDIDEDDINKAAGGRTGYADGGSPSRAVDQNNFYSKADHEARKLSQKKGSPQQIRAMLEKAGVKPEEIDQSGYNETFGDRPSVTTAEVAQHFRDKMPKLSVKRLLSESHDDFDPSEDEETRFDPYTLQGQNNYREHLLKLPVKEGEPSFREGNHWPDHRNVVAHIRMGDRGSPVDPEMAQATIDKMLADEGITRFLGKSSSMWGSGAADFAAERGTITPEEALNLSRYRRWHNDTTSNAKPQRNLHVEEIQSDWAQQGRKHGFAEPGIPPEPTAAERRQEFQAFVSSLREPFIQQTRQNMRPTDTPEERDAMLQMVNHLTRDMNTNHSNARLVASALGREDEFNRMFQRWIEAPIEPKSLPRGPFVTSTPGWTNLALKHILTEAVKGGYDRVVFSPGQANSDMYGGLDEKQEAGLKGFYDQILPTQLNKLVKSLDPDHPGVKMFSHPLPPVSNSGDTKGYKGHALDITDDLRDAVNNGLPAFRQGGMATTPNLMLQKAISLARKAVRK